MGGDGSNVKSSGGLPPSGGHTDSGEDGLAYGGRIVGIAPSGRRSGYSRVVVYQGVHSVVEGHYFGAHCLTARLLAVHGDGEDSGF